MKVKGLDPNMPTVVNAAGAKQSATPYRVDLVPALAILRESEVLATGAAKYGEWNWLGIPISDQLNHALQHIFAYLAGDRSDDHLANLACRAHFALELQERDKQTKTTTDPDKPNLYNLKTAYERGDISRKVFESIIKQRIEEEIENDRKAAETSS